MSGNKFTPISQYHQNISYPLRFALFTEHNFLNIDEYRLPVLKMPHFKLVGNCIIMWTTVHYKSAFFISLWLNYVDVQAVNGYIVQKTLTDLSSVYYRL